MGTDEIIAAICALNDLHGSSCQAIRKYMKQIYGSANKGAFAKAIKTGIQNRKLIHKGVCLCVASNAKLEIPENGFSFWRCGLISFLIFYCHTFFLLAMKFGVLWPFNSLHFVFESTHSSVWMLSNIWIAFASCVHAMKWFLLFPAFVACVHTCILYWVYIFPHCRPNPVWPPFWPNKTHLDNSI